MITKVTEANKAFYQQLFQKINETIGLNIQSIEEYFNNIEAISNYVLRNTNADYFLRLPTDEEVFSINANTRSIAVPAAFRTSGIAVAGDSYAETLWFKIDKYYDIQDLGTNDINIRIYWELPGKVKGYSEPQYKDVWSTPGQVLFGWTIPQLLTELSGNIKLSVRFFNDENGYNFNTLSQEVKIAQALMKIEEYDDVRVDNTSREAVLKRLKNSSASAIYIPRPIFAYLEPKTIGAAQVLDKGNCVLKACAYAERRNDISIEYIWYKGGNVIDSNEYEEAWFETTDKQANIDKYYYSDMLGSLIVDDDTVNNRLANNEPVYEKGSSITVSEAGSYQVKAIAHINDDGVISTSAPAYSELVWTFEGPQDYSIESVGFTVDQDGIISNDEEAAKPVLTVKLPKETDQQSYATWTITLNKDGEEIEGATFPYEVGEEGDYTIDVIKTLNKISLPEKTSMSINVQNEAVPATVTLAEGQSGLVFVNTDITLVYTGIMSDLPYTYKFIMERAEASNPNNWLKFSEKSTPETKYNLSKEGNYRMKIIATYGRSSTTTVSEILARAV